MGQSAALEKPRVQMARPQSNGRAASSRQPSGASQPPAAPPITDVAPPSTDAAAAATPVAGGGQNSSKPGKLKTSATSRRIDEVCQVDSTKCLGSGSFAKVFKGWLKQDGQPVAVKVMEKEALRRMNMPASAVKNEVELMQECVGQERFVAVHDFIEGTTRYYIVLEFCAGGCLQDAAVREEEQHSLRELQVRLLMTHMLEAVSYLHHYKRICHRDVKPHNFLVTGRIVEPSVLVKLADFGIAVRFDKNKLMKEQVGTPAFMAPELHLLPRRSPGYDHKVDIWALGVCMVFLLAAEYPFVDGRGALLRDQLVRGELPLWEEASFQGLFQGFQEKLGMKRKRPSKLARDLIRRLISPKRQTRLDAKSALNHEWFVAPIQEDDGAGDDLPLLRAEDFDEGIKFLEQSAAWAADVAGKAADHAMNNISAVQVSGFEGPLNVDINDDRVQSCVVCYESTGTLGYLCPKCHYAVCVLCLQKLKKPTCPHCRHQPGDMAFAQAIAQTVASASTNVTRIQDAAIKAAAMNVGSVAIDSSVDLQLNEEQMRRKRKCFACQEPSTEWSYACPSCHTNHCYKCTEKHLSKSLQCPCCKESRLNREAIQQYLSIGAAINRAKDLGSGLYSRMASVENPMTQLTTAAESVANALPSLSNQAIAIDKAVASAPLSNVAVGDGYPSMPSRGRLEKCGICGEASSWSDHVCPRCSTSVCATCVCTRLKEDPRCPHCGDRALNVNNMKFTQNVQQARDLVGDLWRLGSEMLGAESFEEGRHKAAVAPRLGPQGSATCRPEANGCQATQPVLHTNSQHDSQDPSVRVPQHGSRAKAQNSKRPPCRLGKSCTNRLAAHTAALAHPGDADYVAWNPDEEQLVSASALVDEPVVSSFSDVAEEVRINPTCQSTRTFSHIREPVEQPRGESGPSRSWKVQPVTTVTRL